MAASTVTKTCTEKGHISASIILEQRKAMMQQCQIVQLKRHLATFTSEADSRDAIVSNAVSQLDQVKGSIQDIVSIHVLLLLNPASAGKDVITR